MTFHKYMRSQFRQSHMKIRDVARASGISESYLYKIVAGLKHVSVRDYVIAICRAAGMDLIRTQWALEINGMVPLNRGDQRDACIIRCINDNRNIRMLNQSLEDEGLTELKVRRDA